jgi:iron only hydrogenase large subunit-like protein
VESKSEITNAESIHTSARHSFYEVNVCVCVGGGGRQKVRRGSQIPSQGTACRQSRHRA